MKKHLVGMLTVPLYFLCIGHAFALSMGIPVTKETQADLGLDFTLSAQRMSEDVVVVRMEIPKKGKLQNLRTIRIRISSGNRTLLSSTPEAKPDKNGTLLVSFHVSPDIADKCSIDLVVPKTPATLRSFEQYYAVELKGYVTDKE